MADITVLPEYALTPTQREAITRLRAEAFPKHGADRSYFKQLPHHRVLAHSGGILVGQVGIDHRMVSVGGKPLPIFGLVDLCVSEATRGRGIGTAILKAVETLARANGIPFVLLLTDVAHFYARVGYALVDADCTWLRIDEHRSYGQTTTHIDGELMIKAIDDDPWPTGLIDFLGYRF